MGILAQYGIDKKDFVIVMLCAVILAQAAFSYLDQETTLKNKWCAQMNATQAGICLSYLPALENCTLRAKPATVSCIEISGGYDPSYFN